MINIYQVSGVAKSQPSILATASAVRTSTWSHTSTGNALIVPWDADGYDPYGYHSTSVNTERLTVPSGLPGAYIAGGGLTWASSATGSRVTYIRHYNSAGTLQRSYETNCYYGVTGQKGQSVSGMFWSVVAGDYFAIYGMQDSGGNLNGVSDIAISSIWCVKVS